MPDISRVTLGWEQRRHSRRVVCWYNKGAVKGFWRGEKTKLQGAMEGQEIQMEDRKGLGLRGSKIGELKKTTNGN